MTMQIKALIKQKSAKRKTLALGNHQLKVKKGSNEIMQMLKLENLCQNERVLGRKTGFKSKQLYEFFQAHAQCVDCKCKQNILLICCVAK